MINKEFCLIWKCLCQDFTIRLFCVRFTVIKMYKNAYWLSMDDFSVSYRCLFIQAVFTC